MGKRKNKDKSRKISKRLKRIERFLRGSNSSDSDEESCQKYEHRSRSRSPVRHQPRSPKRYRARSTSPDRNYSRSFSRSPSVSDPLEICMTEDNQNDTHFPQKAQAPSSVIVHSGPSTSTDTADMTIMNATTTNSLLQDILEALGDPKSKEEVFYPSIPDEISKRWGRVLVDGLTKEQKQEVLEKILVPENFQLVKAPVLNTEISAVLSEPIRNRDKLLEKAQNHLGIGIAGLTNLTASLIEGDMSKLEILKRISDVNQVFLDLHSENTKARRKLVITSLDKKFINMIADAQRDSFLFGSNLGEKVKATKMAEKSGLQIKRNDEAAASNRKYPQQGNWKGPLRSYNHQRSYRPSGQRNRYSAASRRRPPAGDRPAAQGPAARQQPPKPRKT